MGLISTEVEVRLHNKIIKYYENLGYDIPRYKGSDNKFHVKKGTKIKVNINDLSKGSNVYVDVKCDCCGKQYKIMYNTYNSHNHDGKTYCIDCVPTVFRSGEKSHFWNINLTDEEREIGRNYPEYSDFIKRVLVRDKYTCKVCGKKYNNLEVHHLDGYNWCKDKRVDDTNGITLCHNCHGNFHLKYGKGYNTKEQFLEWINTSKLELKKYNGELYVSRKVIRLDDKKIYNSCKEANKDVNGKSVQKIYSCCNYFKNPKTKHYTMNIYGYTYMWLDEYDSLSKKEVKKYYNECIKHRRRIREIICITTGEHFKTAKDANIFYGRDKYDGNFTDCCRGKLRTSGIKDGKKLKWMYYDEYSKLVNSEYIGNFAI